MTLYLTSADVHYGFYRVLFIDLKTYIDYLAQVLTALYNTGDI